MENIVVTNTIEVSIAGADFEINYSRPAKRGRLIFGGLVPWNEVWRTGANAATHFTVDRDLLIGDKEIPAGTYTLWTTFTSDAATLIINRQTRQWGTQYNETQDFARVSLELSRLPESSERFTITISELADGVELGLNWDRSRYSVPVLVR